MQAYDPHGNQLSVTDSHGQTTRVYDALNRVAQVTYPGGKTVQYSFDALGRRSGMTNPDGGVTKYAYDARNRMVSLTNPFSETTGWTYDAGGKVTRLGYGNGAYTLYGYDNAGQILSIQHCKSDGTPIWSMAYSYDLSGNRTQLSESDGSVTNWGYDAAGRLLTDQKQDAEANILFGNSYVYDALGNRTSHTDLNGVTTYQYNGLNQLCMVQYPNGSQVTYTYDGNGNRTAKSEGGNILQSYVFDFENHMVQASGPSGILGNYYYNADGLRVAKVTAAGTVGFLYDDMKLLQEVSATGQTTANYTSTGGSVYSSLLGIANSAGSHIPLGDALGSVRFLLDGTQNVSDGYVYEAFGRQVDGAGQTPNPYHFVGAYGYYQDWETGLQLLTARYYDAEVGRFVTRDPIGFGGGDWNIYGYLHNRVLRGVDPSGLKTNLPMPPTTILDPWEVKEHLSEVKQQCSNLNPGSYNSSQQGTTDRCSECCYAAATGLPAMLSIVYGSVMPGPITIPDVTTWSCVLSCTSTCQNCPSGSMAIRNALDCQLKGSISSAVEGELIDLILNALRSIA